MKKILSLLLLIVAIVLLIISSCSYDKNKPTGALLIATATPTEEVAKPTATLTEEAAKPTATPTEEVAKPTATPTEEEAKPTATPTVVTYEPIFKCDFEGPVDLEQEWLLIKGQGEYLDLKCITKDNNMVLHTQLTIKVLETMRFFMIRRNFKQMRDFSQAERLLIKVRIEGSDAYELADTYEEVIYIGVQKEGVSDISGGRKTRAEVENNKWLDLVFNFSDHANGRGIPEESLQKISGIYVVFIFEMPTQGTIDFYIDDVIVE